jgi:hypothetical protein
LKGPEVLHVCFRFFSSSTYISRLPKMQDNSLHHSHSHVIISSESREPSQSQQRCPTKSTQAAGPKVDQGEAKTRRLSPSIHPSTTHSFA